MMAKQKTLNYEETKALIDELARAMATIRSVQVAIVSVKKRSIISDYRTDEKVTKIIDNIMALTCDLLVEIEKMYYNLPIERTYAWWDYFNMAIAERVPKKKDIPFSCSLELPWISEGRK